MPTVRARRAAPLGATVDTVVYDLWGTPLRTDGAFPGYGRHEGRLGISATNYDWYDGARPGAGSPFPNGTYSLGDWGTTNDGEVYGYHNVWGQVIPVAGAQSERRVRLHVGVPRVWHLDPAQTAWTPIKTTKADAGRLDGGYFNGGHPFGKTVDWIEGVHWREEAEGWSIDLAPVTNPDGTIIDSQAIVHWFFNGFHPRLAIPTGGQVAIHTRMRLISDDGADVNRARFVGAFCGDVFTGLDVWVNPSGVNPPLAQPRHKIIGARWRPFGHVTGTEAQIRGYPTLPFVEG